MLGQIFSERICCGNGDKFVGLEFFFCGLLGEIFVDFMGIMLGEFLFERICCRSGDKFCGCRNFFFGSIGEVLVDLVATM